LLNTKINALLLLSPHCYMLALQTVLMCTVPVVLLQYVTTRQPVHTQHFILLVVKTATYFGSA